MGFGDPGTASVVLASSPDFDGERHQLRPDADQSIVLNLGTTPRTFVIDTAMSAETLNRANTFRNNVIEQLGPGDGEFIGLVERELLGEARGAAINLIRKFHHRWPGDLKRSERNNFSNIPDNFWDVIVQPRVQSLSITVSSE